jgi:cytochrome c556
LADVGAFDGWYRAREQELMIRVTAARHIRVGAAFLASAIVATAYAQTTPPAGAPGPSPARQAIDARRAAFTLIGGNFRPLGAILKGAAPADNAEVNKRATRLAFLAGLLDENFPDASNLGQPDTKAKAEIWSDRADFDKKLKRLQGDVATLVQISGEGKGSADAVKAAIAAVGQDCKACHDKYREQ